MTASIVIAAVGLSFAMQQAPARPAAPRDAGAAVSFTGCVVPAVDREDSFQLVPAEPDKARPVGTSGTSPSPAWTVPAYQLLGGVVSFAEHANKLVEVTGTLEPDAPASDPKRGDTTSRTSGNARLAPVTAPRLNVTAAKVVSATCTPRKMEKSK